MTIAHLKGELFQVSRKCSQLNFLALINYVLPLYLYISKTDNILDFYEKVCHILT